MTRRGRLTNISDFARPSKSEPDKAAFASIGERDAYVKSIWGRLVEDMQKYPIARGMYDICTTYKRHIVIAGNSIIVLSFILAVVLARRSPLPDQRGKTLGM